MTPAPALVQAARPLADRMWRLARMMADPATIWTPDQAEAEMADIHQEIAAFGAEQRALVPTTEELDDIACDLAAAFGQAHRLDEIRHAMSRAYRAGMERLKNTASGGIEAECWYCMKAGHRYSHSEGYNIAMCDGCRDASLRAARPEGT